MDCKRQTTATYPGSTFSVSSFKKPTMISRTSSILSTSSSASSTSSRKRPTLLARSTSKAVRATDRATETMRYTSERLIDWCCVGIERIVL